MIYSNLFNCFRPSFKCGIAAPVGAALVSSGSGLVGDVFDATLGYNQQRHVQNVQMDFQSAENQKNRDWQTEQAEIARQYNTSERLSTQDWQKQMMDYQNEYNTPENQAKRLLAAGINPAVAMSSAGTTSISASPGPGHPQSSPIPSPVSGLSPLSFQPVSLHIPQLMSGVSSVISAMAAAKKANVETGYLESAIPDMLRGLKTDADLNEVSVQMRKLDNEIRKMKLPAEVESAYNDASKAYWDAIVSKLTTGKINNESDVLKSQKALNDSLSKLHSTQEKLFALDVANYGRKLNSLLQLQSAQASESRAIARNQLEQAELNNLERIITRNTQGDIEERTHQELVNLQKQGKILDADVRAADAAAHQAEVASNHAEELFWKDFVLDVVRGGVDAFTSVRNSKSWANMSDASQRRVDAKLKEIENAYGDKVEITTSTPSGGKKVSTYRRPSQVYGNSTPHPNH